MKIRHRSFGEGTVVKVIPMGTDKLLEIDFEGEGQKKLMQRAAANFLEVL